MILTLSPIRDSLSSPLLPYKSFRDEVKAPTAVCLQHRGGSYPEFHVLYTLIVDGDRLPKKKIKELNSAIQELQSERQPQLSTALDWELPRVRVSPMSHILTGYSCVLPQALNDEYIQSTFFGQERYVSQRQRV